jgi:hypothetical protein
VPPMRALRVPSRFDLIVNLALGVLAAIGLHRLRERFAERRTAIGVALIAVMAVEYASSPALVAAARPSLADRWLATQPAGVLAELPMPRLDAMWPNSESRFMYEGTVHWLPMVNGYSGFFPPSYLELLSVMESFPDARSIQYLRDRGVRYLLIRGTFFDDAEIASLRDGLGRAAGVSLVAVFPPPGRELVFTIAR